MVRKAQKRPYVPRRPALTPAPRTSSPAAGSSFETAHRSATAHAHQAELAHRYDYVKTELKRIAFTAVAIVAVLVALSFVIN